MRSNYQQQYQFIEPSPSKHDSNFSNQEYQYNHQSLSKPFQNYPQSSVNQNKNKDRISSNYMPVSSLYRAQTVRKIKNEEPLEETIEKLEIKIIALLEKNPNVLTREIQHYQRDIKQIQFDLTQFKSPEINYDKLKSINDLKLVQQKNDKFKTQLKNLNHQMNYLIQVNESQEIERKKLLSSLQTGNIQIDFQKPSQRNSKIFSNSNSQIHEDEHIKGLKNQYKIKQNQVLEIQSAINQLKSQQKNQDFINLKQEVEQLKQQNKQYNDSFKQTEIDKSFLIGRINNCQSTIKQNQLRNYKLQENHHSNMQKYNEMQLNCHQKEISNKEIKEKCDDIKNLISNIHHNDIKQVDYNKKEVTRENEKLEAENYRLSEKLEHLNRQIHTLEQQKFDIMQEIEHIIEVDHSRQVNLKRTKYYRNYLEKLKHNKNQNTLYKTYTQIELQKTDLSQTLTDKRLDQQSNILEQDKLQNQSIISTKTIQKSDRQTNQQKNIFQEPTNLNQYEILQEPHKNSQEPPKHDEHKKDSNIFE